MRLSTSQVLRKFTQKLAAQNKQANPLTALADPRVLGTLGGSAVGGLGAYGLARLAQSDEDKETSHTPAIAALLGALAGGAGGYYGAPHLAELLKKKPVTIGTPPQSAAELAEAIGAEGGEPAFVPPAAKAKAPADFERGYARPNVSGVDAEEPGMASDKAPSAEPELKFTAGQPDRAQLSAMGLGSR